MMTMIQRLMTIVALAATALAPVTAAQAAEHAATKPAAAKAAAPTAAKVRHMSAQVTSIDTAAKTLTVKRRMRREVTFAVAPEAVGSLADLKPGERVRITYERSEGKLTAQAITPVGHAAAK
jgi:Cu/Ag efflux protein CusF